MLIHNSIQKYLNLKTLISNCKVFIYVNYKILNHDKYSEKNIM